MMLPVRRVSGHSYRLDRADIDTDTILPARFLKTLNRSGLSAGLFETIRAIPGNIFDNPSIAGAPVLVTGRNFGCGSSREHAVWALLDFGIRAVVAPSFSDLFAANAARNGLVTAALPDAVVSTLMMRDGPLTIDVDTLTVAFAGDLFPFPLDPHRRESLLLGRDEIAFTLESDVAISAYESNAGIEPINPM